MKDLKACESKQIKASEKLLAENLMRDLKANGATIFKHRGRWFYRYERGQDKYRLTLTATRVVDPKDIRPMPEVAIRRKLDCEFGFTAGMFFWRWDKGVGGVVWSFRVGRGCVRGLE